MFQKLIVPLLVVAMLSITLAWCQGPVNKACMGCLCEAASACNVVKRCENDVCGPFRITWAYWADAGKPTLRDESPESKTAYVNCATDIYCSALAVQGYMNKFQADCNGDGRIDCDDYALIHINGGYGCTSNLPFAYGNRYQQCKSYVSSHRARP